MLLSTGIVIILRCNYRGKAYFTLSLTVFLVFSKEKEREYAEEHPISKGSSVHYF